MKCSVCLAPLAVRGYVVREYKDVNGRVYKRIRWPRYAPCVRLDDPSAHPARRNPSGA